MFIFSSEFQSIPHTIDEVRAEILKNLEEMDAIHSVLPSSILIGPFHVQVDGMRQDLCKKCKSMCTALLDMWTRAIRKDSENVSFIISGLIGWKSDISTD